jgi:hypothetical protein
MPIMTKPLRSWTGAYARYESFNGGFGVHDALSSIDTLLSRHIGELSISFDTLSTNVLSDENEISQNFDEQQVQCALEVLKIGGVVQQNLSNFEEKTRERLRILAGRIGTTIDQESALTEAVGKSSGSTSLVPDSLSAVEIETMLATSICGKTDDMEGANKSPSVLTLQQLSNFDENAGLVVALLPKSVDSLGRLVKSCQSFVFDFCSALPFKHLNEMNGMAIWGQEESMWSTATTDSYGTLPQSYITQVGEHMLALVQALEPFASDKEALQLVSAVMDGVDHVANKSWISFANAINYYESDDKDLIAMLKKGDILKDFVINYLDNNFDDEEDDGDVDNAAAQAFCNQWLDAVCSAVTGRLLEQTVRIQRLSRKGSEHLSTDFNYIVNVLSALGVSGHPHPLLSHIAELAKMTPEDFLNRMAEASDDGFGIRNTEVRIALMRGLSIN